MSLLLCRFRLSLAEEQPRLHSIPTISTAFSENHACPFACRTVCGMSDSPQKSFAPCTVSNEAQPPAGSKVLRFAHQSLDKAVKPIWALDLLRASKKVSSTRFLLQCSTS